MESMLSNIDFTWEESKGFKYTYEVEYKTNLKKLVKGVNKNILSEDFEGNEITTVLIINKLGNFSNDAEILKRYDFTYDKQTDKKFETPTVAEIPFTGLSTPTGTSSVEK